MLITNKNFRLYYWDRGNGKRMSGYGEIDTSDYYYNIEAGQKLSCIRYTGTNYDIFVQPTIIEVNSDGLIISHLLGNGDVFAPWEKSLPSGEIHAIRNMFIEPCEYLYEKNTLGDILAGTIETETYKDGVWIKNDGSGIWRHSNGTRVGFSRFSENLRSFVKMGQMSLLDSGVR